MYTLFTILERGLQSVEVKIKYCEIKTTASQQLEIQEKEGSG